jgi:predicted Zn-dependent peptidase/outer membrane lipoprotein-sorting protein
MKNTNFKFAIILILFVSLLSTNLFAQKTTKKSKVPEKVQQVEQVQTAPATKINPDVQAQQVNQTTPKYAFSLPPLPQPKPQPAKDFVFPSYKTVTLSNGLKVYLIKDDEQPEITLHLMLAGGQNLDGNKSGLADIATSLMTKGAGKRNALEIAQKLDGIGAGVSVSAGQDAISATGSSLTKHFDEMFEVFADVVLSPKFPKDEFNKLIDQSIAGVKMRKANSGTLASLLSSIATYGDNHPYAKFSTEASLKSITLDDVKNYYKSTFIPNNSTLAVIGDFNEKELIKKLESRFKDWTKGPLPKLDVPNPKPLKRGVYFVPRAGSKQSSVDISALTVPKNHPDYLALRLTSALMGGGFGSKLFRTLREKYSFTYSPFARETGYKFANEFVAGSEVKNDKTDSSITVILDQFKALYQENGVTQEELERVKSNVIGNYQMAFENSEFVASLLQNADFYDEPIDNYKYYAQRIEALTTLDVAKVADKYLKNDRLAIAVVGLPALKDSLAQFGPVYEYTMDLESVDAIAAATPIDLKPEELIEKYIKAIGGKEALNSIKTIKIDSKLQLKSQSQTMNGTSEKIIKYPDKEYTLVQTPMFRQESWVNGDKAWKRNGNDIETITGDELKESIKKVKFFINEIANLITDGYKCEILGVKDGLIKFRYKSKDGNDEGTYYFDRNTFLPMKSVISVEGPQGPMEISQEYSNFETFNGVKLPITIVITNPYYSSELNNNYWINQDVDDAIFTPKDENKK